MSLIQQRIALDRNRVVSILFVALGGLGLLFGVFLILMDPSRWTTWAMLVPWLIFASTGVVRLVQYRTALRAFESEHGVDAGKQ